MQFIGARNLLHQRSSSGPRNTYKVEWIAAINVNLVERRPNYEHLLASWSSIFNAVWSSTWRWWQVCWWFGRQIAGYLFCSIQSTLMMSPLAVWASSRIPPSIGRRRGDCCVCTQFEILLIQIKTRLHFSQWRIETRRKRVCQRSFT